MIPKQTKMDAVGEGKSPTRNYLTVPAGRPEDDEAEEVVVDRGNT